MTQPANTPDAGAAAWALTGKYPDPQSLGAKCSECPLRSVREGQPVPPEFNAGSRVLLIGEAPGKDEVEQGRPFIGPSGHEVERSLSALGVRRDEVSLSNAMLCKPPGQDGLAKLLHKLQKENKKREKQGLLPIPTPMECCVPRLRMELKQFEYVITLGKVGMNAVVGGGRSIFDMRGAPIEGFLDSGGGFHTEAIFAADGSGVRPIRVVPTIHPAFVLRMRRWAKVFRSDLSRALRWFQGRLDWKEPEVIYNPDPDTLRRFLNSGAEFFAYDVETDAKECLVARLRCIGVATTTHVVVVGLLGIDGSSHFYSSAAEEEIEDIFREWFTNPRIVKVGHNAGYYDRIVIEQRLGVTPFPLIDSILLHRAADSELPHNLGFVGSLYTDVTKAWKADHASVNAQTDFQLWEYNGTDCIVSSRIIKPLMDAVELRKQQRVVTVDHQLQAACAGMHINGMFVNQQARRAHDARLKQEALEHRARLCSIVHNPNFNPASVAQVKDLLYGQWGMDATTVGVKPKDAYTKLGEPSTSDDVIRALMRAANTQQKAALDTLRKFRRSAKLRGTYIVRLRLPGEPVDIDDGTAINAETEEGAEAAGDTDDLVPMDPEGVSAKKKAKHGTEDGKRSLILADGRLHPHWNSHGTTSGRFSSSEPNAQNIPRTLRNMFEGEGRRVYVAADMDQLELRYVVGLAGSARYLEVFNSGGDPHAVTSAMLYGTAFTKGTDEDKKRIRDFSKRFVYACLYGAAIDTVHDTIASVENDKGELVFPWLKLKETRVLYDRWLKENPEIVRWWDDIVDEWRRQGYLIEKTLGRRRDFADGEDRNEILNFPVQSAGAGVVHLATLDFLKEVPFGKWGPGTGLVQQGHDALVVEVPCEHDGPQVVEVDPKTGKQKTQWCKKGCNCTAQQVARLLQSCMTRKVAGLPFDVTFTATAKVGKKWSDT